MRQIISAFAFLICSFLFCGYAAADDNGLNQKAAVFVTQYWAGWSQENARALPYIESVVSDPIEFYGKSVSLQEYMKIQIAFANRWPKRNYTLKQNSLVTSCNEQTSICKLSGIVNWVDDSPARQAHSIGSANFEFNLLAKNSGGSDSFFITGQAGAVISRALTTGELVSSPQPNSSISRISLPPKKVVQASNSTTSVN